MPTWPGMLVLGCLLAGGCFPREAQEIGSIDPSSSIPAIQKAARDKDRAAIPALVKQLDSDDPAVRFYSIEALRTLTGQTFRYRYYDDAEARTPALKRWQQWLAKQGR